MTKNFNTARSEYKRQLENLISSQAQAEVQNAGTRGQNAMNWTASTVSAQIDPGKIDGVKYAETLAQGIAEIKAAQQKQLEEQLEQQAKEIAARQKAAAKANAKAEKKQEQAEQSVQAEQGVQDDENTAKGQWTPWGEQSPVVGPVRSGNMEKPSEETVAADGTKEEKKSLWQRVKNAAAKTLQEGVSAAGENLPEETAKIVSGKENAEKAAKEEKIARVKALNRIQAKAREESQTARETNAGLLKKEKLNSAEKEEIYNRVNRWLEEDPQNWNAYHALQTAKNKGRVRELLSAGYTNDQLDEANEYLQLYQKMGLDQVIKERVGNTAMGIGKTIVSAPVQAGAAARQTVINAVNAWQDEEYRNAAKLQNAALLQMQELEESGAAMQRDENGNAVGYADQYKALQQQLAQAQAVLAEKDSEINAPVSKDNIGYRIYQSGQQDLARSDAGLDEGIKFLKGAATSAAENIALAAINPGLVLPALSAQGAADSMAQSTANEEPAFAALAKGGAKFIAGWAINSVGVEQMLDTMGTSGTRESMAAQLVKYLKDKSVLSGFAKNNPGFYAVLMGATDNGLQSFAETWADYAIDLAANTAEPKNMEQLLSESLESAASGAAGGAMTAAAGLGVNAGRQVMADRAQAEQNARAAAENARRAQMAPENARDVAVAANQPAMQNGLNQTQEAAADKNAAVNPAGNAENQNAAQRVEKVAGYDENGLRNDIANLKNELEQGGEISPRVAKMFLAQGSTEEMTQRKLENRKALAQMLGVEESEIPTTLKAAREYLEWVNPEKLVANSEEAQSEQTAAPAQSGDISNVQSNAENAAAMQQAAPTPPVMRAVPTESMNAEMQQMSQEIQDGTGRQVEYFESDNDRVRGAYENGKLYLNKNLSSREAAQQTVIHELTHSQEGTETYEKMRRYIENSEILERAAKAATDLNEPPAGMTWAEAWQQKIKEDYETAGITADPEKEMIAKLCEKYLFADEDAVQTVCKKDMSLAESILSWVKEMISRVRGATMEAELRHIERLYRKGIAEARGQAEQGNKEKQYKVLEDTYSGQSFVQVDEDILNGVPKSQWAKTVREEMKRRYPDGVKVNGWTVFVNKDSRNEFTHSKDTQWLQKNDRSAYKDKMRMVSNIDEIVNAATNVQNEAVKHSRNDNYQSFNHAEALVRVGGNGYIADIVTAIKPSTKEVFYDIVRLTPQKIKEDRSKRYSENPASTYGKRSSNTDNIAPENKNVKPGNEKQFSIADTDSKGNALTEQQRSYFKDSKVVDKNGKLKIMYRGDSSPDVTVFDGKKSSYANLFGKGFYFTDSTSHAGTYGNIREFYLNIKNPIQGGNETVTKNQLVKFLEAVKENEDDYSFENYGENATPESVADEMYGKGDFGIMLDVNNTAIGDMGEAIRLFNEVNGTDYDGVITETETVVYNSEQAKLVSNESPTTNKDIRFALADPVEEKEGMVSREEIGRGRFARAAKAKENGDSMLRALFVDEDVAEETMRSMERAKEESWAQLRSTKEAYRTSSQKVLDRSANGMAWDLKREYHSAADRAELKNRLIDLYADMEGKNTTMEDALGRAREIGMELVQQARLERKANEEMMEAYGDAYQNVTDKVIKLTDSEMQSLLYQWGSLQEFRRKTGNKIRVSTEDGMPIDTLWNELSIDYPGKFETDVNDGDRIGKLAEFVNDIRPQDVERYRGVEQETAEEIGDRIIDGFMDGKVRTEKERVRKELQKQVRQQVKKGVERLNEDNYAYRQELGKEKKKIEQVAVRLGKKLAHPTKAQHIVADADVQMMVKSIADDALAMVTGRFAGESKLPYVGKKLVALSNGLKSLATTDHRYAGFMTVDANGNAVPVKFIRDLNELANTMNSIHKENNSVADLNLETARLLRETLQQVEHELETADKLLSDTIGAEHRESVERTASDIYSEIDQSRKLSTYSKSLGAKAFRAVGDKVAGYNFWTLNSGRIARMMTNYAPNSAFVEVVDALNKGQRKMMLIKSQASALFADVSNNEFTLGFDKKQRKSKTGLGYTKADYDGFSGRQAQRLDVGFKDARTGETVYITPAMRAELAMHLMNEHNRERVFKGGLMIPDVESLCKGNTEEAGRKSHYVKFDLSDPYAAYAQMEKILGDMSDYETQWVEAAKKYFWDYSGKQYNQATIPLWGYEAANVRNYYPAASDAKSLYQNVAQRNQVEFTVENNSNLKERVFMATKPIALNEINRTALKSIDTMSRFCGLAMPMRDFEKLYNYGVDFTASNDAESIKSVMDRVWNGKAGKYWEGVLEDINGGNSKVKDGLAKWFGRLRGNYATAVLYGNASTAMKQAASFPTAAAAIGWKPLADGLANYKNDGAKTMEEINKRVATYSMRNSDGNSVYDMGDTSGLIAQTVNKMPGSGWITKADDLTVKVLGSAAKAYVDGHLDGLQKGSAEYWDKVADVYADCVELTQPNSGTMQLSALSRSKNEIVRGVSMFSNQRIQNYGLMWDAAADLHAQKARLSEAMNDKNATEAAKKAAQQEVARAKEKFANTMSAMVVQSLMIGLMTAAGKLLWHKMDDYRDETGKITAKSFAEKIADDSLDSMLSNFMGISDLIDVGRYFTDKDYSHFDFAVPELDMVNDIVTKTRKFTMAVQKVQENDDPEKADELNKNLRAATVALAEQAGQGFGIPLTNLRKNVMGIWNGIMGVAKGDGWIGEYAYTSENMRSMVNGYMDGRYDLAGANEMLEKYCISKYGKAFGDMEKSERDKAASDMRDQIAKDWKDLYVQATDEERAELAEKLGEIRVGDRKLFTRKAMQAWVDSAEKAVQEKATKDRADRLYDDAVDGLAGQSLYKNMSEEEQIDLESGLNEAAKTAAKLEAGYMITSDLGEGEKYLYERTGKDKEKWLDLKAKYLVVSAQAKKVAKKGENGTGMAEFLRALEKSGYSTADMGALLQAKGGGDKLKNVSDEVRLEYYRAKNYYADADNSGSMNQEEFMAYVGKSGMKRSVANEIWNMIWTPGKKGSTSPYQ